MILGVGFVGLLAVMVVVVDFGCGFHELMVVVAAAVVDFWYEFHGLVDVVVDFGYGFCG